MFLRKVPLIFQNKSLILLLAARISTTIAFQILTVAVGWQIYSLTQMPFYLGLVGLAQFLPMFLLTLVVGYVADRYDRKLIICFSQIVESIGIFLLAFESHNAVSYTHLDVYKRQEYTLIFLLCNVHCNLGCFLEFNRFCVKSECPLY